MATGRLIAFGRWRPRRTSVLIAVAHGGSLAGKADEAKPEDVGGRPGDSGAHGAGGGDDTVVAELSPVG